MKLWLDTNNCSEHFHALERIDGVYTVKHADDTECEETEFGWPEDGDE